MRFILYAVASGFVVPFAQRAAPTATQLTGAAATPRPSSKFAQFAIEIILSFQPCIDFLTNARRPGARVPPAAPPDIRAPLAD